MIVEEVTDYREGGWREDGGGGGEGRTEIGISMVVVGTGRLAEVKGEQGLSGRATPRCRCTADGGSKSHSRKKKEKGPRACIVSERREEEGVEGGAGTKFHVSAHLFRHPFPTGRC